MTETILKPLNVSAEERDNSTEPTLNKIYLSLVIPAYNEEYRLEATLQSIQKYFSKQTFSYEVIIVDDGSRDKTAKLANDWTKQNSKIHLLQMPKNQGKGHAVKRGVLQAQGDYVLVLDADGATPIEEFKRLYSALCASSRSIIIGSRATTLETKIETSLHRKVIGTIFNALLIAFTPGIQDTQCGFKLLPTGIGKLIVNKQTLDGFAFDVEVLHIAMQNNISVIEIPINWTNQPGSKVNVFTDSWIMLFSLGRIAWRSLKGKYKIESEILATVLRKESNPLQKLTP